MVGLSHASSGKWVGSLAGGLVTALPIILIGLAIWLLAPLYLTRIAFAAYVNLLIVLGLQVFMGNSLVANLGQGAFAGIGAYSAAILATPIAMKKMSIPDAPFGLADIALHPALAAGAGLGIAGVIAALTGLVIARLSGEAATIVTFSLMMVVHSIFIHWTELFKGAQAFFGIPQVVGLPGAIAAATLAIVVARMFKDSAPGLQLRASADSLLAARAFGVNVFRLRLIAWILGALMCAAGGMLYASFMGTINARAFHFELVMTTLAMLILGGMRTVSGAVFGCAVLALLLEAIRSIESGVSVAGIALPQLLGLSGLAMGAIIVLGMTFRPRGIFVTLELDELLWRLFRRPTRPSIKEGQRA
jgi:branched-chain amino acid transport system permease protein